MVKHLPTMWETRVQSLGQEDPLEKEMATHSSILAWRISMDREAWWATVRDCTGLDQEGRRGLNEVVPGTSVFPISETGVLGDFWGRIKSAKYRFEIGRAHV